MPPSSSTSRPELNPLLDEFRRALEDCRQLYLSGAHQCAAYHPHLIEGRPEDFVQLMDDLHKGLLAKIYVTVAHADSDWTRPEQQFAEVLFEHIWGRRLTSDELFGAIRQVAHQAGKLNWYSLVRPFERIAPLRGRLGELETIVLRLGNLVAKADGQVSRPERRRLAEISRQLAEIGEPRRRHPQPTASDEPGKHEEALLIGTQAVKQMRDEIGDVRSQCQLGKPEQGRGPTKSRRELIQEAQAELQQLVGIDNIKQEIRTLINFLEIQEQRERAGLPRTSLSLHMVFRGNPGTGKTTVARIVGKIFGAMGILDKGHLVETDRSGLVAEYAGQTAAKTNKKIDEALDGILFIDEAYSLVAESGDDPYGTEAVQALLKRMEDDRQRLVVALAGYPEPIDRLLKSNPGLSSRFSRHVTFHDYSATELGRIFQIMCQTSHYEMPAAVRAKLLLGFQWLLDHRDEHFGNGRLVRNTFEAAIRRLANRIIDIVPLTREVLTTLHPDDIQMPGVPDRVWQKLDDPEQRYRMACPGCGCQSDVPWAYLGQRVQCKRCHHRFAAAWGEPHPRPQ